MKTFLSILLSGIACVFSVFTNAPIKEMTYSDGYSNSSYIGSQIEYVNYDYKTTDEIMIPGGLPKYSNGSDDNGNSCACVAGSTVLGFYDRLYDELIPNFTAARTIKDKIIYTAQNSTIQSLIDTLYIYMGTNTTGYGTSASGCRNGLKRYVEEKNRNISYTSVVSNGNFNYNLYRTAINNNQPTLLFVAQYTICATIQVTEKQDEISKGLYNGAHVLVGCGISTTKYYSNSGSLLKEVTMLRVATGYSEMPLAYLLIDERVNINEGSSVNIY